MTITPAMAQFYELKSRYPDSILFFRMGDFYEMFDEDAHIANKILGIAITTRNKNAEQPTPLAGIPFHAKEKYLPLLIQAGYKVAIAEQVSDPKLKGIVKREVVRVVTPSTLSLEGEIYENHIESNIIMSITVFKETFSISVLNFSNNLWYTSEFSSFEKLREQLYKISPKEVILEKSLFANENIKEILEKKYSLNIYYFEGSKKAKQLLTKHFGTKNLECFGLENKIVSQMASSLLLEYIQINQNTKMNFLNCISYFSFTDCMELDEATIKSLDILYNFSTKSHTIGTLFGVLNKTKTSMGANVLREEIVQPLYNIEKIRERHCFIEEFLSNKILLEKVRQELGNVSNIHSILNRLSLNRANPKDLLQLKKSLQSILTVINTIKTLGTESLQKIIQ